MMEKLHRHGPLSTPFLVEFAGQKFSSRNRTLERLTDLFNEDNTPHQGRYLDRPHQQFATLDARYHDLMYDVLPPAVDALKDTERFFWNTPETSSLKWKHDAFCAAITASVDLAVAKQPEQYDYIFHDEIVTRIGKFEFPHRRASAPAGQSFWYTIQALRPSPHLSHRSRLRDGTFDRPLEAKNSGTHARPLQNLHPRPGVPQVFSARHPLDVALRLLIEKPNAKRDADGGQ